MEGVSDPPLRTFLKQREICMTTVPVTYDDTDDGAIEVKPSVVRLFKEADALAVAEQERMKIGRHRLHETLFRKHG